MELTLSANQPNTAGTFHLLASIKAASSDGKILDTFSNSPPPVMCAKALTFISFIRGNNSFTYILVGVKRASPENQITIVQILIFKKKK